MGLRSLHPARFSNIPNVVIGDSSIEVKDFLFSYGKIEAMNIPKMSVPQGAIVGILGDNGAGKTTFAKCLCGLEKSAKVRCKSEKKFWEQSSESKSVIWSCRM